MTRRYLRFLRRNTIALLALFIALGGTTYAATALPKNSVGPKQLRKNAVTGVKVKNNSLTGADILESSLGKVPTAASADAVAKTFHTGLIKLAVGQMTNVLLFPPFTVYFKCNDLGSNNYQVQWFISTTEDHSAFAGSGPGNGDFGTATVETSRLLSAFQSVNPLYFSPYSIDVAAAAPSGARIVAVATTGVHTLGTACVGSLDGFTS